MKHLDTSALIKRFVAEEITFAAADERLLPAADIRASVGRRPPC